MTPHSDASTTDPQTPQEVDAAVSPGHILGCRYQVRQRLGGGGMGSVWRVHDTHIGEDVALKLLPPQAGTDALVRFRREVTLARRIAHPNTCRVFDLGEADRLHFLTMELIAGENLRARLRRGPLSWLEAQGLIDDLLAGLAAVHGAGIVHRDIKPENILIASDGRAVIVDFGLAWAPTTQIATVPELGTPQYMAPEQLAGGSIDPRTDVFAAAVVIQEVLDGRPPFEGATAALVASAVLRDSPLPLVGKKLPEAFREAIARVVARALSRDPSMRQANASALRTEWLAALANNTVPRNRSRRRSTILGIAVGLALVGGTVEITRRVLARRQTAPGESVSQRALATSDAGVKAGTSDAMVKAEPKALSDAAVKPVAFVVMPPWSPGMSHRIVQGYGTYQHQNTHSLTHVNDFHALDFDLALGEPVYPVADGTVIYAGPATGAWDGFGNIVVVNHKIGDVNYQSLYAHLSSITVHQGAVTTDMLIGRAGRTGTSPTQVELHLSIYYEASFTTTDVNGIGPYGGDAVNPEPFASCIKDGGPCDQLVTGDVLQRTAP